LIQLYRIRALRSTLFSSAASFGSVFDEQPPQRGTLGRIRYGREEFAVVFDIQLGNGLVHGGGFHVTGVSVLLILQRSMRLVERTDVFLTAVNG
jgi:hypothetical protein